MPLEKNKNLPQAVSNNWLGSNIPLNKWFYFTYFIYITVRIKFCRVFFIKLLSSYTYLNLIPPYFHRKKNLWKYYKTASQIPTVYNLAQRTLLMCTIQFFVTLMRNFKSYATKSCHRV